MIVGTPSGFPVDGFEAGGQVCLEGFPDVRDPVAHVVEPRSPPLEEAGDGRTRAGGGEQFDAASSAADEDHLDLLVGNDLAALGGGL